MSMTLRERILAVYRGECPDVVPYMLDLSHWFYYKNRLPWDLSRAYETPERDLIAYHKRAGAGFYIPNLGLFYTVKHGDDVGAEVRKDSSSGGAEITWRYKTPLGSIERTRVWKQDSYSWPIKSWGVNTEQDLRALGYALGSRTYSPRWELYQPWVDSVGGDGVVYLSLGYSAMGHLLNLWMGIEGTICAAHDWPHTMHQVVDQINENNLKLIDLAAASPAEIIILGDNFSSDVQPPHFFREWSRPYYVEAIRRLHAGGKYVAVHIDGKLRGALAMIRDAGADCADAVTPAPMGDLTPAQCREEAGRDFILSGGIAPNLWLPGVGREIFKRAVIEWLDLKKHGPCLIANAGDQVPPGADEARIEIMRALVEKFGRY